jgi:hypothetical protein
MAADPARAQQNQADFWNPKVAAATTPEEVVAVWYDACRMVAKKSKRRGNPEVTNKLANLLHDFYQQHSQ